MPPRTPMIPTIHTGALPADPRCRPASVARSAAAGADDAGADAGAPAARLVAAFVHVARAGLLAPPATGPAARGATATADLATGVVAIAAGRWGSGRLLLGGQRA